MRKIFIIILCLFSSAAQADNVKDFYFAAKRNMHPELFQKASYLAKNHGKPYVFVEKQVHPEDILGISGNNGSDPKTYRDTSLHSWEIDVAQLAIFVTHLKKAAISTGVPSDVWHEALIRYEENQLKLIRSGKRSDRLKNINRKALSSRETGNFDGVLYRGDYKNRTTTARKQNQLLSSLADDRNFSQQERDLLFFYKRLQEYQIKFLGNENVIWMWEPTCECGNGFFSIAVAVKPNRSSVNIISEFGYRVCRDIRRAKPIDLSQCDASHQIGTGQKIYLSGDYRYQVVDSKGVPKLIRSIRLREREQDIFYANERTILFSNEGHRILE